MKTVEVRERTWEELTARQQQIITVFAARISEHGVPPTIRDVVSFMGFSGTNALAAHYQSLRKKGWLARAEDATARGWRLTPLALAHFRRVDADGDRVILTTLAPRLDLTADEAQSLGEELIRQAYVLRGQP